MASNESDFVQKLITQSKKLTEANVKKCQNERIFKELTLFQNLSNFCSESKKSNYFGLEKVFKVSVKVYPSPLRLDPSRCNETMTISVENVSKCFSFSCNYWQFIIDVNNGEQVNSWSLESDLDPGSSESFSSSFFTSPNISPLEVRLSVLFSITHLEQTFVKTVQVYQVSIDVLHLLTPSRYPRTQMYDSSGAFDHTILPFTETIRPTPNNNNKKTRKKEAEEEEETGELPSVTLFFFKLCPNLMKSFIKQILLQDCKSRWLTMKSESDISNLVTTNGSFPIYYLEEEIIVTLKEATVSFKTTNPKLLCALKIAIFKRLLVLENIKVSCPNDDICEKLYALKLRLEELSRPNNGSQIHIRDYVDIYLELRDVSETIEFSGGSIQQNDAEIVTIE